MMVDSNRGRDGSRREALHPPPTYVAEVIFHPGGDPAQARAMERWLEGLSARPGTPHLLVRVEQGLEDRGPLPSLVLPAEGDSRVHYHFIPEGPEWPPFQRLLQESSSMARDRRAAVPPAEPGQGRPTRELLLFLSNHCPTCPQAVGVLVSLAFRLSHLGIHLVEVSRHPRLAEEHEIRSVPTLLLEEGVRYVGPLDEGQLFSLLADEDPVELERERVRQWIRQGEAPEASAWIAAGGDPAFLADDLGGAGFEERIGLLYALEGALERNPRCLDPLVRPLLPHLESPHASVRGDLADLLGKIGHPDALPALARLRRDPDPEVAEAAVEAIERIERKRA